MKKFLFCLLGIMALSLGAISLSSCSDDDDNGSDPGNGGGNTTQTTKIDGRWIDEEEIDKDMVEGYIYYHDGKVEMMAADKPVSFKDGVLYASQAKWYSEASFNYSLKNGKLILMGESYDCTVKGDKMTLKYDGESSTFLKVKEMK